MAARPHLAVWLAAVAGALVWAAVLPHTADLAAQAYRVGLAARHGLVVWDNSWFSGHYMPGYSLLSPLVGALLGLRGLGIACVAVSVAAFAALVSETWPERRAAWPTAWFALAAVGDLCIGRLTYALGLAAGLLALLTVRRGLARGWTLVASLATAAASPVAGLFLVLAGVALPPGRRLLLCAPPLALAAGEALLFPEGGQEPYALTHALVALGAAAAVWLSADRAPVRRGAAIYGLAVLLALALPTPMGSNVARLGVAFAAPLVLLGAGGGAGKRLPELSSWSTPCLAALAVWILWAPVTELRKAAEDPAPRPADFAVLLKELGRRGAQSGRVEVVPTATRWESVFVARRFALARGWQTQLDASRDALFYSPSLSQAAYLRWLHASAVRYVVLKDGPTEAWGRTEAALLRRGVPGVVPVWRGGHWRVWAVRDARPLAPGARTLALDSQRVVLAVPRAESSVLALRWTGAWRVQGPACVSPTADGRVRLQSRGPGRVTLRTVLSLPGNGTHCG